jgi:septal ring factor EnvC (AmiA/AmiB activator)
VRKKKLQNCFLVLINGEGISVIQKGKLLSLVHDLKKEDVQSCKQSSEFKEGLLNIRNKLIKLQKIVHQNVQDCREVKQKYERTICEKHERLKYIDKRVQVAEKAIDEYEKSASDYKQRANKLQKSSDKSKRKAVEHAGAGIIRGTFSIFVGAAFAPVTGNMISF